MTSLSNASTCQKQRLLSFIVKSLRSSKTCFIYMYLELKRNYEGDSINYVTKSIFIKTTCAIFMNDTSLKRSNSCGYSDILHNDNHTFLRRVN